MKKWIALFMSILLCLSLIGCGNLEGTNDNPYKKYSKIFRLLERKDYQGAIAEIEKLSNSQASTPGIDDESSSSTGSISGGDENIVKHPNGNNETQNSNVIHIHTAAELFTTVYENGKTYILEKDLDLTEYTDTIKEMNGVFDGNGKTIRNTKAPLIQKNTGTVQNLKIENAQITGNADAAVLVVENSGTIRDCQVAGQVHAMEKNICASGIACWNDGTVEKCVNYADVFAISYAINELGNVVHGTFACAGGISARNSGMISRCWNAGTISADDADYLSSCGGIVAINSNGEVADCYNTGTVITPTNRGDSGGIAGNSEVNAKLTHCYNIGSAQSGICGDNRDYIIDCYYLSSASSNGSGSGLNPEGERFFAFSMDDLTKQETFSTFDFDSVWKMSDNGPVLQ